MGFVLYVGFIDTHDLISQVQHRIKLHRINQEVIYLKTSIEQTNAQRLELTTNQNSLEKHAREQYRMKRENEEVFVFIYE